MSTVYLALILGLWMATAMADKKLEALKAVSDSSNHFSSNLLKKIADEKKENFVSSPLSAHVVLSMAAFGAGGNTAKQMREALHLPKEDATSREGFENLISHLNKKDNVTLEMANNVFVANNLKLKPSFKEVTTSFGAEPSELDFKNKQDESIKVINDWSDAKTHHKIPEIVNKDVVDSNTRMVLLNAIYFKGNWAKEFKKKDTTDRPFYLDANTQKNVPTMFLKSKFVYGELPELGAKFVELPYQNKDLKMVIIVPDEIEGLGKIIENIEKFNQTALSQAGYEREVFVYLPKFKIETQLDLEKPLTNIGMGEMFSDKADFSNLSEEALKVSKVIQKAMIEVNEEGSEAAAVTVIQVVPYSLRQDLGEKLVLRVDRPFFFEVFDNITNIPLFRGVIVQPDDE